MCRGPRDPATTEYEWVDVAVETICAGTAAGCVDCWGDGAAGGKFDEAYKAFAMDRGLACGVTAGGEPHCWSWYGYPDPVDVGPLLPAGLGFDGVAVNGGSACWTRDEVVSECPVSVCDNATDPADTACVDQPAHGDLDFFVGGVLSYCGLDTGGLLTCWGFPPALALHRPGPYVRLDLAQSACAIDAEGTAWCSTWGNESSAQGDVTGFPGDFVAVGAGRRLLLLDSIGRITDEPFQPAGTEYGYLCDLEAGSFSAVASFSQVSCALPLTGGIECWKEVEPDCVHGTPAQLYPSE